MNNISAIGDRCCGCRACGQACPTQAITFNADEEGFIRPTVDETKCVDCGKCMKLCPVNHISVHDGTQTAYAAKATDNVDLLSASSGGVFFTLAQTIIAEGGAVCGCSIGSDLMPYHTIAHNIEKVRTMRGSKYVQSNIGAVYTEVKSLLQTGKQVLFTGVPCQVAGLRNFLMRDYPNLICADIICHGVPSRKLYGEYLAWLSRKYRGKVVSHEFRNKKRHAWSLTQSTTVERNGKLCSHSLMASLDPYYYNFLQGNSYRESCYSCPYSQTKRPGDITLGDFWGIEREYPELFDIKGVSCVIINSDKGSDLLQRVKDAKLIEAHEVDLLSVVRNNGNLQHPTVRKAIRNDIYKQVNEHGFDAIPYTISRRERIIESLKDCIPNKIRYAVKQVLRRISS